MSKNKPAKPQSSTEGSDSTVVNKPFGSLAALRDSLAPQPSTQESPAVAVRAKKDGPSRAVIRLERKGRGGKEATIIDHLELGESDLLAWCKALKQALGVGGTVEGESIALAGDLRKRLPAVLTARGVKKVVVSGE